jgi:hypothetical protein
MRWREEACNSAAPKPYRLTLLSPPQRPARGYSAKTPRRWSAWENRLRKKGNARVTASFSLLLATMAGQQGGGKQNKDDPESTRRLLKGCVSEATISFHQRSRTTNLNGGHVV